MIPQKILDYAEKYLLPGTEILLAYRQDGRYAMDILAPEGSTRVSFTLEGHWISAVALPAGPSTLATEASLLKRWKAE